MPLSQNHDKPLTIALFYSKWVNKCISTESSIDFMDDLESLKQHYLSEGYQEAMTSIESEGKLKYDLNKRIPSKRL